MTDKEIVERAKEAEKRTSFGELVHSPISKGVNSAFGIGFIEGMVEYRNSMQKEPISEEFEKALAKEWQGYVDRGAATVDALEDNTQELAFAKGFYRGWNYPKSSVWHDAKDTPVASKTKIVLYTNGKWDMFKAYETKDDYDNYWAGVNQALEEKGVLVKRWAYVEDLSKL